MKIQKAVLTVAGRGQSSLPLQKIVDRDGRPKTVLRILLDEILLAGVEQVAVVLDPQSREACLEAVGEVAGRVTPVEQPEPDGYADALLRARDFVGDAAFLHLVGDHLFASPGSARALVELARRERCAVSAVQATRETELARYGVVGGRRVVGQDRLYEVQRVLEKPTPTVAEQELHVPGLRAGHYLCFFGMHVLTPAILQRLAARVASDEAPAGGELSAVLDEGAGHERYLALEMENRRFDLGDRYGLLSAQLAIGLQGRERELVLDTVVDVLAWRERRAIAAAAPDGAHADAGGEA